MNPERWRRIDELLEHALERPPHERAGYLEAACKDDQDLRLEVEALLRADREADAFLETPPRVPRFLDEDGEAGGDPVNAAGELDDVRSGLGRNAGGGGVSLAGGDKAAGDRIGPYRIEREIGRGGMGTVYLAVRAGDVYQRKVAVKLLNPGMKTAGLIRRFRSEGQILARLEHPNVARLYEGGTADDGRPYLAMEYIEGVPIDSYCDRRRLPVRERLELVRQVCSAVHYAHRNLVVHRDVKPSNILVGDDGTPRLLDFGIAKLLDPEDFPYSVEATLTSQRPMTPHYASPEQIRGDTITTATDVYSLGVLLYQLLTGRLPHLLGGLSPREIERVLTEDEPPRPSTVIPKGSGAAPGLAPAEQAASQRVASGEDAEVLSRRRGVRPQQLRRQLAGDLDNIVLMALRKEPERRYGSAEQLSQDLRRHLLGLPVIARGETLGYQLGKLLRRHRLAVGVAALVFVLSLTFAGAMAWQAAETARQRDRAEVERDKAREVTRFLVDLFREVDPFRTSDTEITAREVLEHGARKIEQELQDQPEIRASLQDAIGTVHVYLGQFDQALPLLEAALETRREALPPEDLDVAESMARVGMLYRRLQRLDDAEPLLERALEVRRQALGPVHQSIGQSLGALSLLHQMRGDYRRAEELGLEALEVFRRSVGPEHPEVATTLRAVAGNYVRQGRNDEAERMMEEALAIDLRAQGEVHYATASDRVNLAFLRIARSDYEQAGQLLAKSLAAYEQILGDAHPQVADTLIQLGLVASAGGRHDEAEARVERAVAIFEEKFGRDHPRVADALDDLGVVLEAAGKPAEAEAVLRRGLTILDATLGDHPLSTETFFELGDLLARQDRLDEAEPLLVRALRIREQVGESTPEVAQSLAGLAELRRRQGDAAAAEEMLRRAYAIWQEHPRNPKTAAIPQAYAALLRAAGRAGEAAAVEASGAG